MEQFRKPCTPISLILLARIQSEFLCRCLSLIFACFLPFQKRVFRASHRALLSAVIAAWLEPMLHILKL